MTLGQDFADLVNDVHDRLETAFRSAGGQFDMATSDAATAVSIASDVFRPTYMIAAHRLLLAAEELVADGRGEPAIAEAALHLRRVYPG